MNETGGRLSTYGRIAVLTALSIFWLGCSPDRFNNVEFSEQASSDQGALQEHFEKYRPALVISDGRCLFCHASVKGNVISDFGGGEGPWQAHNATPYSRGAGDYYLGNWIGWGNISSWGTAFFEGDIYVPNRTVADDTRRRFESAFLAGQNGQTGLFNGPAIRTDIDVRFNSLPQFLEIALNGRTPAMIDHLRNRPGLPKSPNVRPVAQIAGVSAVHIGNPTENELVALLPYGSRTDYVKDDGATVELQGLASHLDYFSIDETGLHCEGDLVINGPLYWKNPRLYSKTGCRIYTTGTVVLDVRGNGQPDRQAVEFMDEGGSLQISSARAVLVGMGLCDEGSPTAILDSSNREMPPAVKADVLAMKDGSGRVLPRDVGGCADRSDPRRKAKLEHTLLHAPRVDARITGDFKGAIITQFSVWSLGSFRYEYDPIFQRTKVLPKLRADQVFTVSE